MRLPLNKEITVEYICSDATFVVAKEGDKIVFTLKIDLIEEVFTVPMASVMAVGARKALNLTRIGASTLYRYELGRMLYCLDAYEKIQISRASGVVGMTSEQRKLASGFTRTNPMSGMSGAQMRQFHARSNNLMNA